MTFLDISRYDKHLSCFVAAMKEQCLKINKNPSILQKRQVPHHKVYFIKNNMHNVFIPSNDYYMLIYMFSSIYLLKGGIVIRISVCGILLNHIFLGILFFLCFCCILSDFNLKMQHETQKI